MNNETKRGVFEDMAIRYTSYLANVLYENGNHHSCDREAEQDTEKFRARYAAALPDDLPVIPKAVGKILRSKHGQTDLFDVFETAKSGREISDTLAWIIDSQNTFARAWVLGVWRVEGTGEIVKL
jgi:hypothetical protein